MYCSHFWGISLISKLTSFECKFFKRIFNVPNYTPNWFVYLETKIRPIEAQILINSMYFLNKIRNFPTNSLLRSCLTGLTTNVSSSKMIRNWYRELSHALQTYDCSHLLAIPDCISSANKIELSIKNYHVNRMNNSSMMPFYKYAYEDTLEKIYDAKSWRLVRLAFQIKCNFGKFSVKKETLKLKCYNASFMQNLSISCECSLSPEDLYHVLYECD